MFKLKIVLDSEIRFLLLSLILTFQLRNDDGEIHDLSSPFLMLLAE